MRALIIDDEQSAREGIASLARSTSLDIIGEAKDGQEALSLINLLNPDLIFLDIQMPGINGLDVLSSLDKEMLPIVIFCTAYDQYAIKAFELQAIDYLLKPFTEDRFMQAVAHAQSQFTNTSRMESLNKLEQLLASYQLDSVDSSIVDHTNSPSQLLIKAKGKVHFIQLDDIHWIESLDAYLRIYHEKQTFIVRGSLKLLAYKYGNTLTRVHKSRLVNLSKVDYMESDFNGDFFLTLKSGTQIRGSRNYKQNLPQAL